LAEQESHDVDVVVVGAHLAPAHARALEDEAEFLVQRARPRVGRVHGQLDLLESRGARGVERRAHEPLTPARAAPRREDAHPEHPVCA
jgi:hypothetical protein